MEHAFCPILRGGTQRRVLILSRSGKKKTLGNISKLDLNKYKS